VRETRSPAAQADLPVTVYTPESPLRHPAALLKGMLRDLLASRELAWRLFVRDTSAPYRQSLLGYAWLFIPPLVVGLPFVFLNAQGVISIEGTAVPYAAFAIIGTTIWQSFADALLSPVKTVSASRGMLLRVNFPREAILLAGMGQVVFATLIRMLLVVFVMLWFEITPAGTAWLFPLGVAAIIMVGFTVGVLLVPAGALFGDVQQGLPILAMFLMLLTPVVYPAPETGTAAAVAKWNPLTPLVTVTRDWLTTGAADQLPGFLIVTVVSLTMLFVGWIVYRLALPHVIARMGN
jgi:lipopolysaccharide transport system permease protein